jgi:hypothetical protein
VKTLLLTHFMEQQERYSEIIEKLNRGMKFGLFESGMKCYFQDGTHISYNDLWRAIRLQNNVENAEKKSLAQICPDTYVGTHSYKHSRHNWNKGNASR